LVAGVTHPDHKGHHRTMWIVVRENNLDRATDTRAPTQKLVQALLA